MSPTATPRTLIALLALTSACGSTPPPAAVYSAEELNRLAGPPQPEEVLGASSTNVGSPTPSEPGAGTSEPAPPAPAGLRVIHASPDRAAASVSVFLDDSTVAAVQAVGFKAIAGYLELPSGEHRVSVRAARAPAGATPLVASPTPLLDPGARYTAIVHGLSRAAPRLAIAVSTDTLMQPDAGKARVRFFHALVGLGAVDVCTAAQPARAAVTAGPNRPAQPARAAVPAATVFANVAYGTFGEYTEVIAGSPVTLQVRAQGARPCAGAVRGTVTLTPADRAVVTAVAVGRAPAVARQLLVCGDAPVSGPPACAALPIR